MQLLSLFVLLAPTIVTVQAGCFTSGEHWSDGKVNALGAVDKLCNNGQLSGDFGINPPNDVKYKCVGLPGDKRAQFWVTWEGRGAGKLSKGECKKRLKAEINGCEQGGESTHNDFTFKSDPNAGPC